MKPGVFYFLTSIILGFGCLPCEPLGIICEVNDNSSMIIDSELYVFQHEIVASSNLSDRDSIINMYYSFARSNNPGATQSEVSFGIIVDLTFKMTSQGTMEYMDGDVEFIEDGEWGITYEFDSIATEVWDYKPPSCYDGNGFLHERPSSLIASIVGRISRNGESMPFRFNLHTVSTKVDHSEC